MNTVCSPGLSYKVNYGLPWFDTALDKTPKRRDYLIGTTELGWPSEQSVLI